MGNEQAEAGSRSNRRDFVLAGAGITAGGLASLSLIDELAAQDASAPKPTRTILKPGQRIVFQGDSITDAGRDKNDDKANSQRALGNGYAWLAASQLLVDAPDADYKVFNRGISGNKVYQLAERWQADCLDLRPDVLSVLIGVNDYWHKKKHNYDGTVEKYEADYRELVERSQAALPDVRLVICEPFILLSGEVTPDWVLEFSRYRAAAKRVAEESAAVFVPFQSMFEIASKVAEPKVWAADGVHPSPSGAALMAHWWLKSVGA